MLFDHFYFFIKFSDSQDCLALNEKSAVLEKEPPKIFLNLSDGVDDNYYCVPENIEEANYDQNPPDVPSCLIIDEVAKTKKKDTKNVNGNLVANVLTIDNIILPLPLYTCVGEHNQSAEHGDIHS